jgi:hypothetical protein
LEGDSFAAQLVGIGFQSLADLAKSWDDLHFKVNKADARLNGGEEGVIPDLILEVPVSQLLSWGLLPL